MGNLASMAAMMALPWALIGASDTSYWYAIIWDILLSLHLISLYSEEIRSYSNSFVC